MYNVLEVTLILRSVNVPYPFDGLCTICNGPHDFVVWRDGRVCDVLVLELNSVAVPIAALVFDVTFVCVVVLRGSGKVPAID